MLCVLEVGVRRTGDARPGLEVTYVTSATCCYQEPRQITATMCKWRNITQLFPLEERIARSKQLVATYQYMTVPVPCLGKTETFVLFDYS